MARTAGLAIADLGEGADMRAWREAPLGAAVMHVALFANGRRAAVCLEDGRVAVLAVHPEPDAPSVVQGTALVGAVDLGALSSAPCAIAVDREGVAHVITADGIAAPLRTSDKALAGADRSWWRKRGGDSIPGNTCGLPFFASCGSYRIRI